MKSRESEELGLNSLHLETISHWEYFGAEHRKHSQDSGTLASRDASGIGLGKAPTWGFTATLSILGREVRYREVLLHLLQSRKRSSERMLHISGFGRIFIPHRRLVCLLYTHHDRQRLNSRDPFGRYES